MLALVGCSEPVTGGADGGPDSGFIVRDAGSDVDAGRTSEDAGPDANLRDANLNDAIFAEPDLCIAAAETCNGLDDDCDGTVDDGVPTGASCSAGIGACARTGTTLCVSGALTGCSAVAGAPGTETCNGLDDDCDGTVDDGVPTGAPCSSGVGACARTGTTLCVGGALTGCSAVAGAPGTETCNTVDDDCDGTVDEDICYIVATGGTIVQDGRYKVHTFNDSGIFTVISGSGTIESLVIAGGGQAGSGGGFYGGGGGGGGEAIATFPGATSAIRAYAVVVGTGGTGGGLTGGSGTNSSVAGIVARGGTGGSPGGGNSGDFTGGAANSNGAGGGAGSGGNGGNAPAGTVGGSGGVGISSIITGAVVFYASGGGGGGQVTEEPWAASAPADASGGDVWNTPGNYSDETPF